MPGADSSISVVKEPIGKNLATTKKAIGLKTNGYVGLRTNCYVSWSKMATESSDADDTTTASTMLSFFDIIFETTAFCPFKHEHMKFDPSHFYIGPKRTSPFSRLEKSKSGFALCKKARAQISCARV